MQLTRNQAGSVGATSVQLLEIPGGKRVMFCVTNTGATTITICKGDVPAVASAGIVLAPGGQYLESSDNEFICWNGRIQAVGSGAGGTVAVVETIEASGVE
jgi:hypothetical protein